MILLVQTREKLRYIIMLGFTSTAVIPVEQGRHVSMSIVSVRLLKNVTVKIHTHTPIKIFFGLFDFSFILFIDLT